MAAVEFNEEPLIPVRSTKNSARPISSWLINCGLAKDEKSAQYIQLVFVVGALIISGGMFLFGSPENRRVPYNSPDQTMVPDATGSSSVHLE